MSSPLDPLFEALSNYWWGRLIIAVLLFAFAAFMAFAVPSFALPGGGRFDVCCHATAVVAAAMGVYFAVTGLRGRRDRGITWPPPRS